LSERYDFIYAAAGVHPSEVYSLKEEDIDWLRETAKHPKVVAIGEIGLDYHYEDTVREVQKDWFVRQLALAREVKLPVCIHSREAAQDTLDIMRAAKSEQIGGVIHCFSYGWDMAKIYLDMGFYLGIGGVVTFKNAKKLKEVVQKAPMERLVLETDAPYLAPVPHRGERNVSSNLQYVAEEIATLRDMTPEEVIRITEENGRKLYHIKD
jgi:TatD DNase family protein